jgi:hypothetical protein
LGVSGSISSSLFGTASYATQGLSSSYALTASYALNSVGGGTALTSGSLYNITSSWAVTASYALSSPGGAGAIAGINSTGSVAVNKTSSQANLDISGSVFISGSLNVSGSIFGITKSFLIKHPTKAGMVLEHGVLEGPEHSVYVRGKTNSNKISLPDYWTGLVYADSITVQLTPIGIYQNLFVVDTNINEITISNISGEDIYCYYYVHAERKDISKLTVEY